jgi:hypothetical protein
MFERESEPALAMVNWLKKQDEADSKKKFEERGRKDFPHVTVLTFKIEVRELQPNGIMGESVLSKNELRKFGMSDKAQIYIKGATESECIQKVKNLLENLDVEAKR